MPKRKSFAVKKPPPPRPGGAVVAFWDDDGHDEHDSMQDDAPASPVIPAKASVSTGMDQPAAGAAGGAVAAGIGSVATGDASGGRRGALSSGRAVRTRRQAKAAAAARPLRPPVRPPVRYVRGGGFGLFGYPRIDLELSSARAKFRRIDASLRELDEDVALVDREVAEVRSGLKREAEDRFERMNELEREVSAAAAAAGTLSEPDRLAVASEMLRKAKEWEATSKAELAVWKERNKVCKRMNQAVDRKRRRIQLALEKVQYYHRVAVQAVAVQAAAAAPPRGGGLAPQFDDDDSD